MAKYAERAEGDRARARENGHAVVEVRDVEALTNVVKYAEASTAAVAGIRAQRLLRRSSRSATTASAGPIRRSEPVYRTIGTGTTIVPRALSI